MVSATTASKKTITTAQAISARTMARPKAETSAEEDLRHEDILVPVPEDLCAEDLCHAGDLCAEAPCHVEGLCHAEDRCAEGLCHAEDHEVAVPCLDPAAAASRLLAEEVVRPLPCRLHLILQQTEEASTISVEAAIRLSLATNEPTISTRNPAYWTTWPPWRSVDRPVDDRRRNEDRPTTMAAGDLLWKARGVRPGAWAWAGIPIRDRDPLRRTRDTAVTMTMVTEHPCRLAATILGHREGA